jgi:hypothetical protein
MNKYQKEHKNSITFPVTIEDLQQALRSLKRQVDQNEDKLEQTTARVETLETTVADDREKTIQTLADHSERVDFQSNQSKSHCVLITGINFSIRLLLRKIDNVSVLSGLKRAEFPSDLASQNAKANEIIKEMIQKVLGREEPFKLSVRRGANVLRKARDSTMLLLPPIEVWCT